MRPGDLLHLERCIELAERGARTAAPNPLVGCVIVRDGHVIGEGWHERPGMPHAERASGVAPIAWLLIGWISAETLRVRAAADRETMII